MTAIRENINPSDPFDEADAPIIAQPDGRAVGLSATWIKTHCPDILFRKYPFISSHIQFPV